MSQFNVGHDLNTSISVGGQVIAEFGLQTTTQFTQNWKMIEVTPTNYNGLTVSRPIYKNWTIDLSFARVNGTGDNIAQILEDIYKSQGTTPVVTMLQTIASSDGTGSIDQYRYINGVMWMSDAGTYKGDEAVMCKFHFAFQERNLVSSNSSTTLTGGTIGG